METRGKGRAVRTEREAPRVRTRAQAAAEAAARESATQPSSSRTPRGATAPTPAASAPGASGPSTRSATGAAAASPSSRGGRKRTRSSRRVAQSSTTPQGPSDEVGPSERPAKRGRRGAQNNRGGSSRGASSRGGSSRGASSRARGSQTRASASRSTSTSTRGRSSASRGASSRGGSRSRGRGRSLYTRGASRLRMDHASNGSGDSPGPGGWNGEGPSSLNSDRAGTAALQGLLRSLGAGLDDMFPIPTGSSQSRIRGILNTLRSSEDSSMQLDALTQLCDYLSVGTEESMVSFSVDAFVPPLVNLLNDGTPDTKLLSARAITHLMDALPTAASSISHHGASVPLCANLLSIQYIDLAEQSLSALEKLSTDFPHPIVRAGGFSAALSFIDFFSTGVQRVAASTVCNLCRSPPPDSMDMIVEVLPAMHQLLDSQDQRIREYTVQGFSRLADGFRGSSSKLENLCSENAVLVDKILGLVVPASPPALAPACYASALHLLSTLARGSAVLSAKLMTTNSLIMKMKHRLETNGSPHALDFLSIADALLPESGNPEDVPPTSSRSRRRRNNSGITSALAAVDAVRRSGLESDSEPLENFGKSLFKALMRFFVASADMNNRQLALSVLSKFVSIAPDTVLAALILTSSSASDDATADVSFCPFVATLLGENSAHGEAQIGLSLVNSALVKVPDVKKAFIREGVMHELVRLSSLATKKEEEEEVTETSSTPAARAQSGSTSNPSRSEGLNEAGNLSRSLRQIAGLDIRDRALRSSSVGTSRHPPSSRSGPGSSILSSDFASSSRLAIRVGAIRSAASDAAVQAVAKRALDIVQTHLNTDENGVVNLDDMKSLVLEELTSIHDALVEAAKVKDASCGVEPIDDILRSITADSGISVYEFSCSRIVDALFEYLLASDWSSEVRTDRCLVFIEAMNKYSTKKPFLLLVRRLLGALSAEEKLRIQINESSSSGSSVHSGLRQLSQPFKLRLRRASAEDSRGELKDYSHHVVLIEPLATMSSVHDFLWPRVSNVTSQRRHQPRRASTSNENDNGSDGPGQGMDSDVMEDELAASDMNEDGENPIDPDNEDDVMDGNDDVDNFDEGAIFGMDADAADEMDAAAADEEEEHAHNDDNSDEDMSSGSDDVIEHGDGDDEDMDTDNPGLGLDPHQPGSLPAFELDHDAFSQIRMPLRGLGSIDGESFRSRQSSALARARSSGEVPTSALRSYAAALTGASRAVGRSSSHRSTQGLSRNDSHRDRSAPRLTFSMNNVQIAHERSILSAVVRSSRRSGSVGSRLWSEVHTLTYTKIRNTAGQGSSTGAATSSAAGSSSLRRSSRLRQSSSPSSNTAVILSTAVNRAKLELSQDILSSISDGCISISVPRMAILQDLPDQIAKYVALLSYLNWVQRHSDPRSLDGSQVLRLLTECGSSMDFVSHKITSKVKRQVADPLALCSGAIPRWCFAIAKHASFLIPFETRRILFQSTALGVARALHLLQTREDIANSSNGVQNSSQRSSRRESEARMGRIQRQKVRIHRSRMLESAVRVMTMYAGHSTVLEVEYFDEVGTGLGPTLEFYTLASREVQRLDLNLWRAKNLPTTEDKGQGNSRRSIDGSKPGKPSGSRSSRRRSRGSSPKTARENCTSRSGDKDKIKKTEYVEPSGRGLFPSPSAKKAPSPSQDMFMFIGRLVGKALADGRLLDLRFSQTFCELLLAFVTVLETEDAWEVGDEDEAFFNSIGGGDTVKLSQKIKCLGADDVWAKFCSGRSPLSMLRVIDPQLASSLQNLLDMLSNGQRDDVAGLCLSYTLPGHDSIELVPKGSEKEVNGDNLEDYVSRVVTQVLFAGVRRQTESFLCGFSEVLDLRSLRLFQASELEMLICGPAHEDWTVEFLVQATRCDHGFRHESEAVLTLFKVLSELTPDEQRRFVLFVTGSPALPLGGLRNLNPRLTIVKRTPEGNRSPDECLPTVMTCTNYLKLPDYSNYEIAKERIMYAIQEGQGSFHLS